MLVFSEFSLFKYFHFPFLHILPLFVHAFTPVLWMVKADFLFMGQPPSPPPGALLTVLFTGGGSSADPKSVRRCEQLSQRPKQRSRPKTNQYQPD